MASEPQLRRQGPLEGLAEDVAMAGDEAVHLQAAPARRIVNLRGIPDEGLVTDLQMALGAELPLMPNRWHGDERLAAIWLGPDEWLLAAPDDEAVGIEKVLREARPNDPWLSVVDVSHNYAAIRLSGRNVRAVLAKGCALDLRPDVFAAGHCAQTLLAKAPVLMLALTDAGAVELWFRNSYARYLVAWLRKASVAPPL